MPIFTSLIILFTACCAVAESNFVILTGVSDERVSENEGATDPFHDAQYGMDLLRKAGAANENSILMVDSNKKLSNWLSYTSTTSVKGLFIRAHGTNKNGYPQLINTTKTFNVNLLDINSIKSAFGPIIGKFGPHARLIFDSCSLLNNKSPDEAKSIMMQVLKNFEITSGCMYMNETLGALPPELVFSQYPVSKHMSTRKNIGQVGVWMAWPVTVPVFYAMDYFANRGYLLCLDQQTSDEPYYFEKMRMKKAISKMSEL